MSTISSSDDLLWGINKAWGIFSYPASATVDSTSIISELGKKEDPNAIIKDNSYLTVSGMIAGGVGLIHGFLDFINISNIEQQNLITQAGLDKAAILIAIAKLSIDMGKLWDESLQTGGIVKNSTILSVVSDIAALGSLRLAVLAATSPYWAGAVMSLGAASIMLSLYPLALPKSAEGTEIATNIANFFNSIRPDWDAIRHEFNSDTRLAMTAMGFPPQIGNGNISYGTTQIDPQSATHFSKASQTLVRRDPLVLDLDGNGVQTTAPSLTNPILFDHSGYGVKNGTGWISAGDAFVVMDRNGNGTIDNGTELFGDATSLPTGGKADNGFAALAPLDSNKDGKISATDTQFAQLKVWRDLNQDGVSQNNELQTLTQAGVASINLSADFTQTTLPSGNVVYGKGTFTRTTGTTGEALSAAMNLNLLNDTFNRQFTDIIPIADDVKNLPNMQGSGAVRDLQEAASLSSTLKQKLQAFTQASTRTAQRNLLDSLIITWGETSALALPWDTSLGGTTSYALGGVLTASQFHALERFNGRSILASTGTDTNALITAMANHTVNFSTTSLAELKQSYEALKESIYGALVVQTRLKPYMDAISLKAGSNNTLQMDFAAMNTLLETKKSVDSATAVADLVELNRYAGLNLHRMGWDGLERLKNTMDQYASNATIQALLTELNVRQITTTSNPTEKSDILFGTSTTYYVEGGNGNDILSARYGGKSLIGGEGNDLLEGGDTSIMLQGGNGNDVIKAGRANEELQGGDGADTYYFTRKIGVDRIQNQEFTAFGSTNDVIQLGDGIIPSEVHLSRGGTSLVKNDLIIQLPNNGDRIEVIGYFNADATTSNAIESIRFADGTIWDVETVKAQVLKGSPIDEFIIGYATNDTLNGSAGADSLWGNAGFDTLIGGEGNDTLWGGSEGDWIQGDDGIDTLNGEDGNDSIFGMEGNDSLTGGNGQDWLNGGAGNDSLSGGAESDTYVFGRGLGKDTIINGDADALDINADRIYLPDVSVSDILLSRLGNDLLLNIKGEPDQLKVTNYFLSDATTSEVVEYIDFADGTRWDWTYIKQHILNGSSGDDLYLQGYTTNDVIKGGEGKDFLYGGEGSDTLYGGTGADTLNGDNGSDWLEGNEGADTLNAGAGDDLLFGGAGHDALSGGSGSDTYVFAKGGGTDTISNYDTDAFGVLPDTLLFNGTINESEVKLYRSGDTLSARIIGTDDRVDISNYFYLDGTTPYTIEALRFMNGTVWNYATVKSKALTTTPPTIPTISGTTASETLTGWDYINDTIQGNDGNDSLSGLLGNDRLQGGSGNDTLLGDGGDDLLQGDDGADWLNGGDGDDNVQGGSGDDTLISGAGFDTLNGGAGSDNYLFNLGTGYDLISQYDTTLGKVDAVTFDTNINPADVILSRNGFDLNVSLKTNTDRLVIANFFSSDATAGYQVEQFRFTGGIVWDLAALKQKVLTGNAGDNTLTGYASSDTLYGMEGHDTLEGLDGADTLVGGWGNDTLRGGNGGDWIQGDGGDDTLLGGAGDDTLIGGNGINTLNGESGNDTYMLVKGLGGQSKVSNYDSTGTESDNVFLAWGIEASNLWFERKGQDLQLTVLETGDAMTLQNWYSAPNYRVDYFQLSDNRRLLESQVDQLVNAMAAFNPAPLMGGTALPPSHQAILAPILAANWQ